MHEVAVPMFFCVGAAYISRSVFRVITEVRCVSLGRLETEQSMCRIGSTDPNRICNKRKWIKMRYERGMKELQFASQSVQVARSAGL